MAKQSIVINMSPLILNNDEDLDLWEVVNASDGEYSDDSFSVDSLSDDDVISLDDDASFVSTTLISQIVPEDNGADLAADLDLNGHVGGDSDEVSRDEIGDKDLVRAQRRMVLLRGGSSRYSLGITYGDFVNRGGCYDEGDEEEEEDMEGEYDDDLDDELVPRSVCKKLGGRQRMRKLGKRAIAAKVLTSTKKKTSPYSYLKTGCVRGKHGLGIKFKC
ncbi:unnamed protein product [Cochlearia groenlandica]